jgi:hypothetical protein
LIAGDAAFLAGCIDFEFVLGRRIVAAVSGIGVEPFDRIADELLDRLNTGMYDRPASWRTPNPKQMEKLARERARDKSPPESNPAPDESPPPEWWDSVLSDPRAAGTSWSPIQQRRLSEIPRPLLRVECLR